MTLQTITPDADYLTPEQIAQLLRAINPLRVGKDGKGHAHVQAYECRAHLNRILGFARWSEELTDLSPIFESENANRWTVAYRATIKVTINAPSGKVLAVYAEASTGEAINQPSRGDAHDLALKTAQSQAFKRCLVNLGDQFGNSLYARGSTKALTGRTLLMPDVRAAAEGIDDEAVAAPVPAESEQVGDKRITNEPTAAPQPAPSAAPKENPELTKWVKTLMAGPGDDEPVAPFYARMHVAANKGKFLNSLVENRNSEMVSAGALLADEQKRTQRDRAA